jgi:hypothetical protein
LVLVATQVVVTPVVVALVVALVVVVALVLAAPVAHRRGAAQGQRLSREGRWSSDISCGPRELLTSVHRG